MWLFPGMLNVESNQMDGAELSWDVRWWFRRLEVVRAEVREPIDVISNRIEVPEEEEFDVEQLLLVAGTLWFQVSGLSWGVRVDGLAWLPEWFSTCPDVSYLSCACSRSCTRDPRLDCLTLRFRLLFSSWFLEYICIYRIIHVLCQEKNTMFL